MKELLPAVIPEFAKANVVDSHVQKYPGAVTWFSPGSYTSRPPLKTSLSNLVCAGDWVRMGDREHGAKGLCQERAYVSGLEAANVLESEGVLGRATRFKSHRVIPIREDEPQVVLGRIANKQVMDVLAKFNLDSPWVR
uniref:Amine oxidase domain-containing protein n=1 Tax=Hanusia phi TaxID=3032 RepID=A0A7S0HWJ1_9CRYP|mmetsp:Transcript_5102/g.12061  ORF Transcript_5102/g.12061 Transcript_5102/m.12061 type:complete len:138 (+) Transcript_5102:1-414(+)